MPKFDIFAMYSGVKLLGQVEAKDYEDAIEIAELDETVRKNIKNLGKDCNNWVYEAQLTELDKNFKTWSNLTTKENS